MAPPFVRSTRWPYSRHLYALIGVAAIVLIGLTLRVTAIQHEPGHSFLALFLIKMSITVPEVAIWLLAARSAKRFKRYASSIRNEIDGHNINLLANGLLWLVGYLVVLCLSFPVQTIFATSRYVTAATALTNHLPILLVLTASIYVFTGSRGLVKLAKNDFWNRRNAIMLFLPFVIFMIAYATNFYLEAAHLHDVRGNLRFRLPVPVLLFSYVLPNIIVWTFGLLAGFNLWWYAHRVNGAIYKNAFSKTQNGLVTVFISIFAVQLVISSPYAAANFQIGILLIYAVLILTIVGYVLIYKGARKLQNLEDVV